MKVLVTCRQNSTGSEGRLTVHIISERDKCEYEGSVKQRITIPIGDGITYQQLQEASQSFLELVDTISRF